MMAATSPVDYPPDNVLDPVAILEWAIDTGIFDIAYSAWGWPVAEIVHFTGLCLLMGTVGLFDVRLLGGLKAIGLAALHKLVPFGVLGFALSLASGTVFVASAPDQYLYNPAFQVKLGLMGLAGVNMALFYLVAGGKVKALGPDQPVPWAARLFALVSLLSWTGVIAAGRVITAFRPRRGSGARGAVERPQAAGAPPWPGQITACATITCPVCALKVTDGLPCSRQPSSRALDTRSQKAWSSGPVRQR